MSCVEYHNVEMEESGSEKQGEARPQKPFIVSSSRVRPMDHVAARVAAVLDLELAHGSMPA